MTRPKDKVNEAAWNLSNSVRDASQAIADSAVAAQERNVKFVQSIFENGVELLKSHAEGTRALTSTLVEQVQKQQAAFQVLAQETWNAYVDYLYAPFSYYEQTLDTAESIARQGMEAAQRVIRPEKQAANSTTR